MTFLISNQHDSSGQILATDRAQPSANFQEINQDESVLHIPAPPHAISPPKDRDDPFIQISTANNTPNKQTTLIRDELGS